MRKAPRDLAQRIRDRRNRERLQDGFARETFTLPRNAAREKTRELLRCYPPAAYMTQVESWRELPDGCVGFTIRRLASAD